MADFDPDAYLAEKEDEFDPDAYLQAVEDFDPDTYLSEDKAEQPETAAEKEETSRYSDLLAGREEEYEDKLDAEWAGFGQEMTLGFSDEIEGATQGAADWAVAKLFGDADKSAKGKNKTFQDYYKKQRDEARAEISELKEKYPKAYSTGEWVGIVAPFLTGVGGMAKGAAQQTVKQAIKKGTKSTSQATALGATEAAGYSEKEGLESLEDAEAGAKFGAGSALGLKTLKKAGKVASKTPLVGGPFRTSAVYAMGEGLASGAGGPAAVAAAAALDKVRRKLSRGAIAKLEKGAAGEYGPAVQKLLAQDKYEQALARITAREVTESSNEDKKTKRKDVIEAIKKEQN